jgi:CubicO group peptidase (beta-lactamase class C family)
MSLGVLHQGKIIHQANFGYRDVAAQIQPDENTSYVLGSLTKAFTAAMVGMLVEENQLSWGTNLHDIFPEFQRHKNDPSSGIMISDLLSHRTGLPGCDGLWVLSNNRVALERSQAVPILSYIPTVRPLRTEFVYNNFAYEVVGQVIEKLTGMKYATFLHDRLLEPLGMTRTFYSDVSHDDGNDNIAKPYASLEDGSLFEIPPPLQGENVLMGAAGGIRSSVKDLLGLYKAFIEAANSNFGCGHSSTANPLKQLTGLWNGMIGMPFPSLRENTYALGWVRAQLPNVGAMEGPYMGPVKNPVIGEGSTSRLALYHQGNIAGFITFAALFPETTSAIVVLSNSVGLCEGTKLVGQLLIEALFNPNVNPKDYIKLANSSAIHGASIMSDIIKQIERLRTVTELTHSLHTYTGRYHNAIHNFFIDILEEDDKLRVSFMGLGSEVFDLYPYQADSFFWKMSHNECAKRGRVTEFPMDYYILKFGCPSTKDDEEQNHMCCLWWKHDSNLAGHGEVFRKSNIDVQHHDLHFHGFQ